MYEDIMYNYCLLKDYQDEVFFFFSGVNIKKSCVFLSSGLYLSWVPCEFCNLCFIFVCDIGSPSCALFEY